jgi:polysaccharide export outer membrane protein
MMGKTFLYRILFGTMLLLAFSSCSLKKIKYIQDIDSSTKMRVAYEQALTIKPDDQMMIIVSCRDPQVAAMFNQPYYTNRIGGSEAMNNSIIGSSYSYTQQVTGYTVDSNGDINFPIIGKIHVAGLKREELSEHIKNVLVASNQIKDPTVTVEYTNLGISIMGEVKTPGRYRINRERFTIFDAISVAGDMTVYGDRKNITLIRHTGENDEFYKLDFTQAQNLYNSPAFFVHQGDVIYVSPNRKKASESSVNGNTVKSASFWVSVSSFLTSVAVLITNNKKK